MTSTGITNYVDFIRQAISGRSNVRPEKVNTGNPLVEVFNIPSQKIRDDIDLSTEPHEDGSVPSRWTSGDLYINDINAPMGYRVNQDAFARVREQLRSEGIDADSRTPTHEITDEQMDRLEARYDFDYLSVCGYQHTEFGNFMLDLAYMNVFSLDEVEVMCGVMPFSADYQAVSLYYHGDPVTGEGAGYVSLNSDGRIIGEEEMKTEYITNYLKSKYTGHTEEEYKEMTAKFAAQMQERLKISDDIFARFTDKMWDIMDIVKPNVENISDKLKEDFGGLIRG